MARYCLGITDLPSGKAEFLIIPNIASFNRHNNTITMNSGKEYQVKDDDLLRVTQAIDNFYQSSSTST